MDTAGVERGNKRMSEYITEHYYDGGQIRSWQREEITRCRDCKHFLPSKYAPIVKTGTCTGMRPTEYSDSCVAIAESDGFCWRGERRDA